MKYVYHNVSVVRVIDGDTVRLSIDMGNKIKWEENFRLNGIDTPDIDKLKKEESKQYLSKLLINGVHYVETFKPDKFGRWLIDIYIAVSGGDIKVNHLIITEGYGIPYFGGKKEL